MFPSVSTMHVYQKPLLPPPFAVPQYCPFLKNTGSDYIGQYINCLVYIWMKHRNSFWMYPVDLIDVVLFGYAWDGSDWKYIQLNINLIDSLY